MKKIILTLVLLTIVTISGLGLIRSRSVSKVNEGETQEENVLGVENMVDTITFQDVDFKVYNTPFFEGEKIRLIPNFSEKKTATDLKKEYNCSYLVNAGFYTQEARPVGFFKSTENALKEEKESLLFDAFFTINEFRTPRITRSLPVDQIIYGVQVGPLLFENATPISLKIKNDKYARRMVLIVNGENKVSFLALTGTSSTFSGPMMATLPDILTKWSEKTGNKIADAVNLDGGSASAFLTPGVELNEVSSIGSAFCIKE